MGEYGGNRVGMYVIGCVVSLVRTECSDVECYVFLFF